MVRTASFDSSGMKKGAWSEDEDHKLTAYIMRYGHWNWRLLPKYAGLARCGKSCRLRWVNYLKPGVKRGNFTKEEEELLSKLHEELGNKWSAIASKLPGRTDNEVKNYWHTHIRKRWRINKTNPPSKNIEGKCSPTENQSGNSDSYLEEAVQPLKITSFETILIESPTSSVINTPKELEQNPANSFTTKSPESITTESNFLDISWPNISPSPFPIDPANYSFRTDCLSPFLENEFINYQNFQYNCNMLEHQFSSFKTSLDWFADDDPVHGSFWSQLLSSVDDTYFSLDRML